MSAHYGFESSNIYVHSHLGPNHVAAGGVGYHPDGSEQLTLLAQSQRSGRKRDREHQGGSQAVNGLMNGFGGDGTHSLDSEMNKSAAAKVR